MQKYTDKTRETNFFGCTHTLPLPRRMATTSLHDTCRLEQHSLHGEQSRSKKEEAEVSRDRRTKRETAATLCPPQS